MATVGAIIPSFNRASMLCDCLESLLLQTRPLNEILVVDDGSTDGTADIVSARFGGRVRVLAKENGGKAAALNFGLEQLRTDFVWICDDDDIAAPQGCEVLAAALEGAAEEVGFAHGHYRIFRQTGSDITLRPPSFWSDPEEQDIHINTLEDMYIFQFATMIRRSALESVGRFREDLLRSQDYDMMIRIAGAFEGIYVPETIFFQREHDGSRGPALDRIAQTASFKRWLHYDTLFFRDLARQKRELVPSFARDCSPEIRARAADLQRAVIFGRRGMWDVAIQALSLAASRARDKPASPEEVRLAGRLIRHGLPSEALPCRLDHLAQFRTLRAGSPYGAAVSAAVARALTARLRVSIRQRRFREAWREALFLFVESGGRALLVKFAERAGLRSKPARPATTPVATGVVRPSEVVTFSALLSAIEERRAPRWIGSPRSSPAHAVEGLILRSA